MIFTILIFFVATMALIEAFIPHSAKRATASTPGVLSEDFRTTDCSPKLLSLFQKSPFSRGTVLLSSPDDSAPQYTRKQLLKEETEAPFRNIRYFLYLSLTLSAALATLITGTSLLAVNSGVREGDLPELYKNLAINLGGLPVIAYFWRRDIKSQQSLLQRIDKGGKLATLKLKIEDELTGETTLVKLSDLRRDRGIEKRVIIVAAPRELLKESISSTKDMYKSLILNDLLIVPLVVTTAAANSGNNDFALSTMSTEALFASDAIDSKGEKKSSLPEDVCYIGQPSQIGMWNQVIKSEFETAIRQNTGALERGITLVIKKNGKVGSRRLGVPIYEQLSEDVENRRQLGMDITNI